jgi:hypothetical protein
MASPHFDKFHQAFELITKPQVLEVLDRLGRGGALHDPTPFDIGTEEVESALQFLTEIGVVDVDTTPVRGYRRHVTLTLKGRHLLNALERASMSDASHDDIGACRAQAVRPRTDYR